MEGGESMSADRSRSCVHGDFTVQFPNGGKVTIKYCEGGNESGGRGDRVIRIWCHGVEKSDAIYNIAPNPHKDRNYNKTNNQKLHKDFYETMAIAIVGASTFDKNNVPTWAAGVSTEWKSEPYTLKKQQEQQK